MKRLMPRVGAAACASVATLALLASVATATGSLTIEPAEQFTATESSVTFQETGRTFRITCSTTVGGSFAGGVEKAAARSLEGGTIAEIRSGRTSGCTESFGSGEVVFLVEAGSPFLARYDAFLGTLPNITGILATVLAAKLQVTSSFLRIRCLYEGPVPILVPIERGSATRFSFQENTARLISGPETCPREGSLRGNMRLSTTQTFTLSESREEETRAALRVTPDPMVFERNEEIKALRLKNRSRRPVLVRRGLPEPQEGQVTAGAEAACAIPLMFNEECAIIVTKVTPPARGNIVVEYRVGLHFASEIRIRYEARE